MADRDEFVPIDRGMGLLDPHARYWLRRVQACAREFENLLDELLPHEELLRPLAFDQWGYAQDPSLALQWLCRQYILLLSLYTTMGKANHALRAAQTALHETLLEVHEDHLAALRNLVARSDD